MVDDSRFESDLNHVRDGDRRRFDELLDRWRPFLKKRAHRLLGRSMAGRADSSDLVQDVLARVHRSFGTFSGNTKQEWVGWLDRILAHEAVRSRRFHLAKKRTVLCEERHDPAHSFVARSADRDLAELERIARIMAAVESLPTRMRDIVVRRIFHNEPYERIAEDLGCSEVTARVTWTRAIRELRDSLKLNDS